MDKDSYEDGAALLARLHQLEDGISIPPPSLPSLITILLIFTNIKARLDYWNCSFYHSLFVERDELRKDIEQLCMQNSGPAYVAVATRMHSQRYKSSL